jgi:hypothetical protein
VIFEQETAPFHPPDLPASGDARYQPFPLVTEPEVLPLRSQRHIPTQSPHSAFASLALSFTPGPDVPALGECNRGRSNK